MNAPDTINAMKDRFSLLKNSHSPPAKSAAKNVGLQRSASPARNPATTAARVLLRQVRTAMAASDSATPNRSTRYRPSQGVSSRSLGNASATKSRPANMPAHFSPAFRPAITPTITAAAMPHASERARPGPKPGPTRI